MSVDSALRYWGCTLQAGAVVSGAFAMSSLKPGVDSLERIKDLLAPLPVSSLTLPAFMNPQISNMAIVNKCSEHARKLLSSPEIDVMKLLPSVKFDQAQKSVTLLMPGFQKSDIKLYQVSSMCINFMFLVSYVFWWNLSSSCPRVQCSLFQHLFF